MGWKRLTAIGGLCVMAGVAVGAEGGKVLRMGTGTAAATGGSKPVGTATSKLASKPASKPATIPPTTRKSLVVKNQSFVTVAPITVKMRLMDPEKGLKPKEYYGEAGACETQFRSGFGFEFAPPDLREEGGEVVARLRVLEPYVKVSLALELWLPENAAEWLVDHEETHRAISERVYAEGVVELGKFMREQINGKVFEGRGANKDQAKNAARKEVLTRIDKEYLRVLVLRQRALNKEFDRLSKHGMDQSKSAGEWMKQVFAEEKRE